MSEKQAQAKAIREELALVREAIHNVYGRLKNARDTGVNRRELEHVLNELRGRENRAAYQLSELAHDFFEPSRA